MNFGTLKDIFAEKLIDSYILENEEGKILYRKFLKIIKESETLKTAFIVFKNIENKTLDSEISANEYLKDSISLFEVFKKEKSLNKEINKLTSLLEENGVDYKNKETKELHKNLQNLIISPKNIHTLNKIQESKQNVVSWLISEKIKNNKSNDDSEKYVRENINLNKFLDIVTNKFNEKYKDSLTEEEKNILKVLRENDKEKNKTLVSGLVKENIILINQKLKEHGDNLEIKSRLLETKDTIYKMAEDKDGFGENVLKLYELKKNLAL